jgi:hypothetical protein
MSSKQGFVCHLEDFVRPELNFVCEAQSFISDLGNLVRSELSFICGGQGFVYGLESLLRSVTEERGANFVPVGEEKK